MRSRRIKWLDFAKGITILSVLLIHTFNYGVLAKSYSANCLFGFLNLIICIPAMPIFFAISGYLYKPSNTLKKYKILLYKKMTSFVIPYFIFMIILICMTIVGHRPLLQIVDNHIFWPAGYLWFLYTLFFIFIIVGIFDLFHLNIFFQVMISIILLFWQMIFWTSKSPFSPSSCIGSYLICFYIGYIIKKFDLIYYLKLTKMEPIYLMISWTIISCINYYIFGRGYTFDLLTYQDCFIKLFSIFVFFSVFASIPTNGIFNYFTKYGRYTLIIYLVHYPIITIMNFLLKRYVLNLNSAIIIIIIISIVGWYLSIFVCYLSHKIMIINFIFYPRKYINNYLHV